MKDFTAELRELESHLLRLQIIRGIEEAECDHGVAFDEDAARGLRPREVRQRWPRGHGVCPKGCGYVGIAYKSWAHYIAGDW